MKPHMHLLKITTFSLYQTSQNYQQSRQNLGTFLENKVQANFDLRNSIFPFLSQDLFDLRKIYVLNLETGRLKKCEFAS